jgi:serine/threonine protein phosphatase PrpC
MIMPTLGNVKDQAYFGIYDGHGKDGHHCARYARDHVSQFIPLTSLCLLKLFCIQLAKNIVDKLERIPAATVNTKTIKTALTMAHLSTNEAVSLHIFNLIS